MAQDIEKQVTINPMDYGRLREIALEHIGRISSKYWTDHGIHDPGITMLEQLCFALVDLGYRTSFDIRDILTPEGCSQPQTKDSFILAEDILPCAPITICDYKRLILQNMRGTVQNVHIDTEKKEFTLVPGIFKDKDKSELSVNGYYKILIEPAGNPEDVDVSKIEELLLANRNICEHFTKPVVLSPLPVGIIADIELEPETDYREVTKEIWDGVRKYITPEIPYHTLDELLSGGKALDEILEGPVPPFDGDFVMEEDLPTISRRTELYVSDVKRIILEIAGVRSIKHLNFYLPTDEEGIATIVDGTLKLGPNAADTRYLTLQGLSFDRTDITRIVYEINGIPFELGRHLSCEPVMFKPDEAVPEIKAPVHIPVPEGRYRNLTMYRSPQDEMPEAYHVGKAGISPYETPENKAKRLQLKAYMSFFDQILSDYLEQLSSVATLLSWKECDSTYFHHKLTDDEILDISKVLEEYEGYGRAVDERRGAQRKSAMLSHLLARFNETFVDYSILRYLQKPGSNAYDFSLKESVKDKKAFLSDYVGISARRSQGNPILHFTDQEAWKYSDVEMRISRKLGIDNPPARLAPALSKKSKEGAPVFEDNSNDDYNSVFGLHLIEHSLLVPDGNIIDAGTFLRLSTNELGEDLAADPYSFQITAVLPGWLNICGNGFFRDHVERIIREEIPAHVSVKVCWISMECMYGIENNYISLLSALAENADTSGKLEKFIVAFDTVRNIYPTSHIYSYDETLLSASQDDFTRLNFSAIGESPAEYPEALELPENPSVSEASTLQLKVRAIPEGTSLAGLEWTSSRREVATVDKDGNVVGLQLGKSLITVTAAGGAKASCILSVTEMSLKELGVRLSCSTLSIPVGETDKLAVEIPDGVPTVFLSRILSGTFKSSDNSVATVDRNGFVTMLAEGEAVISYDVPKYDFSIQCTVKAGKKEFVTVSNDDRSIALDVGQSHKVEVKANRTDIPYDLIFVSADESIATVDADGVITAVSKGETRITAEPKGQTNGNIIVFVYVSETVAGIKMDVKEMEVEPGVLTEVSAHTFPDNGKSYPIIFESSDPEIVCFENEGETMVNDYFRGLQPGTATITVRTVDGDFSDTCTVKVLGIEDILDGIKMDVKEMEVEPGVLTEVSAHTFPDNGKTYLIRFESSDPEVVCFPDNRDTMVNGYFKGLKPGTATITVRTVDGDFSDTCTVKVLGADEIYEGIKMDEKEIEAEVGVLTMVSAHPYPDDGKICLMRFESSDPEIVYFENNIDTYINSYFKGLKPGTATITVRMVDGSYSDTCTVKVLGYDHFIDSLKMDEKEMEVEVGVLTKISAHTYPDDGHSYPIRFESSDPEIVHFEHDIDTFVNSYFTGLKPGTATVTVRTVEGGFSDTCVVTVKGKETTPEVPDNILEKKEELELKKKLIGVVLRLLLDHIK